MSAMTLGRRTYGVVVLLTLMASIPLNALNEATHRLINVAATGTYSQDGYSETFDRHLRESLGLRDGRATLLRHGGQRLTPELWIGVGGEQEDLGSRFSVTGRFYRHFHNPLMPWAQAGLLTRYPFHLVPHQYTSSVHWMQATDQSSDDGGADGGRWAWRNARELYRRALTASDSAARDAAAADLFRALGQIMHLVVDASVPEHVRNDPHPFGSISREVLRGRRAVNYEYWVSDEQRRLGDGTFASRYLSLPVALDDQLLRLPAPVGEAMATLPIARLIDADVYRPESPDPNATLAGPVGIAEFANANFFSEDTLFGREPQNSALPFPNRLHLVRRPDVAPRGSHTRSYWRKPAGQGLVTNVALAECRFDKLTGLVPVPPFPCVDEAVWHETATHMLPRAVGYARGVLDYFFRADFGVLVTPTNSGVLIRIHNRSEETLEGTFDVYARLGAGSSTERRERVAMLNEGMVLMLEPDEAITLPFNIAIGDPSPYFVLVFRGRMGLENDAVVGRVFSVPYVGFFQDSYQADVQKTSCTTQPVTGISQHPPFGERLQCLWTPVRHRIAGRIVTNFVGTDPGDPTAPALERIEAKWIGPQPGPAPLTIDDVQYASGVWTRGEDDATPERFSILDPASRGASQLWITAYLRAPDDTTFTQQLATFAETQSLNGKVASFLSSSGWRVQVQEIWTVAPLVQLAVERPIAIGGFAVPTRMATANNELILVSSTQGFYNHTTTTFGLSKEEATARLAAITLEATFPRPPAFAWSAVVERLPLPAGMLRYWNAFVAPGEPTVHRFELVGNEAQ